jgi:hypothetical protein
LAEAPRYFQTARVVVCVVTVRNQLDDTKVRKGNTIGNVTGRAEDCLICILETIEVVTDRPEITGFNRPVDPDLSLDIQQVLHGV